MVLVVGSSFHKNVSGLVASGCAQDRATLRQWVEGGPAQRGEIYQPALPQASVVSGVISSQDNHLTGLILAARGSTEWHRGGGWLLCPAIGFDVIAIHFVALSVLG